MMRWLKIAVVFCLSIAVSPVASAFPPGDSLRLVALTGSQAPGTTAGVSFSGLNAPALNDTGQTAFFALLTGPGVTATNNNGIWSEGAGSLALVARTGERPPGTTDDVRYQFFRNPLLNDAGQTAFWAGLTGGVAGNDHGIWSEESGTLQLVALNGEPAPGTPLGIHFTRLAQPGIDLPLFGKGGQTAFFAELGGVGLSGTDHLGVWSTGAGGLGLVARQGTQAPGTPPGTHFGGFTAPFFARAMNVAGQVAFAATLVGSQVDSTNNLGVWIADTASSSLVLRKGSQAPGKPDGYTIANLGSPTINNRSDLSFIGAIAAPSGNTDGIFSLRSGVLTDVALRLSHAPGTIGDTTFNSFGLPVLNERGQSAFFATLSGGDVSSSNDRGIWSEGGGSLQLVARTGSQAQGLPASVLYNSFNSAIVLNNLGQTAFFATLAGPGIDGTNDRGVWATDVGGVPQLIARRGDVLEFAPGDFRIIGNVSFVADSGNSDGRPSGFNNRGQMALLVRFTDGSSGIFVSNLVAVPEPASSALMAFAMAFVLLRTPLRRR